MCMFHFYLFKQVLQTPTGHIHNCVFKALRRPNCHHFVFCTMANWTFTKKLSTSAIYAKGALMPFRVSCCRCIFRRIQPLLGGYCYCCYSKLPCPQSLKKYCSFFLRCSVLLTRGSVGLLRW